MPMFYILQIMTFLSIYERAKCLKLFKSQLTLLSIKLECLCRYTSSLGNDKSLSLRTWPYRASTQVSSSPVVKVIERFCLYSTKFRNKLECLSLANFSSLVQCLRVRLEPIRVKHLSRALLWGRLLALSRNFRLGWKNLPETGTLAYYKNS